jgi:hypothetical protein
VLFVAGLVVMLETGRHTALNHVGVGALGAGVAVAGSAWLNRTSNDQEREASLRKTRHVVFIVAVVTVAAFLSVKLLH